MTIGRGRPLLFLPSLAALVLAGALTVVSSIPFERMQAAVDALSPKGHSVGFTPELFHSAVSAMRVVSVALIAVALVAYVFRERLARSVSAEAEALRGYAADLWATARGVIRSERREHVAALIAIILAGAALRAAALTQPVNYDEAFTFVTYVRRPLWVSLANYSYPNNHLLHTVLAHWSTQLLGVTPWALRLPAFIAGSLMIPLTYAWARRTWDPATGLAAAALVATSEVLIAFSILARGYTLVGLFFLLLLICAGDIARGERRAWPLFVIAASLGFYAVPTFLYAYMVVMAVIVAGARGRNGSARHVAVDLLVHTVAVAATVAALYAPAMMVTGLRSAATYGLGDTSAALSGVAAFEEFLRATWIDLFRGAPAGVIAVLVTAFAFSLAAAPRREPIVLVVAVLLLAGCGTAAQHVVIPPRAFLFATPVYFCIAGAGLVLVLRTAVRMLRLEAASIDRAITVALIVPLVLSAWVMRPRQYTEVYGPEEIAMNKDAAQVVTYLKSHMRPHDAIVSVFPTVDLLEYYFWQERLPTAPLKSVPEGSDRYLVVTNEAIGQRLGDVLDKAGISGAAASSARVLIQFEHNTIFHILR